MEACLSIEAIHDAAACGVLDEATQAHLDACDRCRAAVEAARAENALAHELFVAVAAAPNPATARPPEPDAGELAAGMRIGRYTIVSTLGHGGMGVVYEAEQDAPRRRIALKLIRAEFAGPSLIRRFEHEAAAMALVKHPGIAQVYEAGVAPIGGPGGRERPFMAMELVRGRRLDQFVREQHLPRPAILDLVRRICDAVDHAHRRGVIHRDLKPGNILVEVDEAPAPAAAGAAPLRARPKVLDFGVAKLRSPDGQAGGVEATHAGGFVGTLAYAAPEQVAGDASAIDARCDVYALGVILYELLTGSRPYSLDGSLNEVVRTISEARIIPPRALGVRLDRDLHTIVMKALAADPARRYQSAALLGEDLARYLDRRPILARADSTLYVVRKAVQRRPLVAAAGALALAALGSAAWMQARANRAERIQAGVTDSVFALMAQTDQDEETPRVDSIPTLLDLAASEVDRQLAAYPRARADLLWHLGNAQRAHRRFDEAERIQREVVAERRLDPGPGSQRLADALEQLGRTLHLRGRHEEALAAFEETLALRRAVLGDADPRTIEARYRVGTALHGWRRYDQARPHLLAAAEAQRAVDPASHQLAEYLTALAACVRGQGRYDEALGMAREALGIIEALPAEHLARKHAAVILSNIVANLISLGRLAEAEEYLRRGLQLREAWYGPSDPRIADTLVQMAGLALRRAEPLERSDPIRASLLDAARAHASRALRLRRAVYPGADHESVAEALSIAGQVELAAGNLDEAQRVLGEALEMRRRLGAENPGALGRSESLLGDCLRRMGRHADAEPLLRAGLRHTAEGYGARNRFTLEAAGRLGELLAATQRAWEADALRAALTP